MIESSSIISWFKEKIHIFKVLLHKLLLEEILSSTVDNIHLLSEKTEDFQWK